MTFEELMDLVKNLVDECEAYANGEIKDSMSTEARENWIEKCNS